MELPHFLSLSRHHTLLPFFAEEIPTQHEVHQYHQATLDLMEEVEIM